MLHRRVVLELLARQCPILSRIYTCGSTQYGMPRVPFARSTLARYLVPASTPTLVNPDKQVGPYLLNFEFNHFAVLTPAPARAPHHPLWYVLHVAWMSRDWYWLLSLPSLTLASRGEYSDPYRDLQPRPSTVAATTATQPPSSQDPDSSLEACCSNPALPLPIPFQGNQGY